MRAGSWRRHTRPGSSFPPESRRRRAEALAARLSGTAAAPLVAGAVELESLAVTSTRPAEAVAPDTAGRPATVAAGKAAAAREPVTEKRAAVPESTVTAGTAPPTGTAAAGESAARQAGAAAHEPAGAPATWALRDGKARAAFRWQAPSGPFDLGALDLAGSLSVPPLETLAATLHARGAFDPSSGKVRLDESEIAAAELARVHLSGTGSAWASRGGSDRAAFHVVVEQAELARWRAFLRPLIGDPAPGYSVTGSAGAELAGAVGADGAVRAGGKATIEKSGFSSGDGSQVLQGLDTVWDLRLTAALDPPSGAIGAKAKVGGFQLLWGSLFADGSDLDSELVIDAAIGAAPSATSAAENLKAAAGPGANAGTHDVPWRVGATWTFPDGPRIVGAIASPEPQGMAYAIAIEAADLGATVARYLRGPFGESVPWFRRIEAGGSLRAKASGVIGAPAITMTGNASRSTGSASRGPKGPPRWRGSTSSCRSTCAGARRRRAVRARSRAARERGISASAG